MDVDVDVEQLLAGHGTSLRWMTNVANDDDCFGHVQSLHDADTAAQQLGIELREAGAGTAVVALTVGNQHLGSLGQLHGGVLFTVADVAMSYAGNSRGGTFDGDPGCNRLHRRCQYRRCARGYCGRTQSAR